MFCLAVPRKKVGMLEKSVYSKRKKGHFKKPEVQLAEVDCCASKKNVAATDTASQKYLRQLHPSIMSGEKGCSQRKKRALQKTCGGIAC